MTRCTLLQYFFFPPILSCLQEPLRRKPRKDSVSFPSKDRLMFFFITALVMGSMTVCMRAKQSSSMLRKEKRDRRPLTLLPLNTRALSLGPCVSEEQGGAIIIF